jgi:cyclic pyranopterin phosphate synthase
MRSERATDVESLRDSLGRSLHYLRLAVTERCNFSCVYCLPNGCQKGPGEQPLSLAELDRLVGAFAALGFWKIRVTGGEPTIRPDVCEIVRRIAATPGVRSVALTTNGYRLAGLAPALREAGLTSVNVSLDSLDPARFARITGSRNLGAVTAGVEAAIAAGVPTVKVNVVLLQGMDEAELDRFLAWTRHQPIAVRFIELMRTGDNGAFFGRNHRPAEEIRRKLAQRGWACLDGERSEGPAVTYGHPDHRGRAGLIAPHSANFCGACNRLRVSATGELRLCLFGERVIPLRPLLQADDQREELVALVRTAVQAKPASHLLHEGRFGATATLAATGG